MPLTQEGCSHSERAAKKVGLGISDVQEALVSQPLHSALLGCLQKGCRVVEQVLTSLDR